MAENEQAEGATEGAESAPSKKGKLKLLIAVGGFVAILGAGGGAWFFMMRGHGEEKHAEAPPAKPPARAS
jgi:flagellar FliL protein